MKITINRTNFTGFGTQITDEGIYMAFKLDFVREGGIVFYNSEDYSLYGKVPLDPSISYGDVYVLSVKGVPHDILFRLYDDNGEFTDIYSPVKIYNNGYGIPVDISHAYSRINSLGFYKDIAKDKNPQIPFSDSVFYLAHVRGLTMLDSHVKAKGTFNGISEKIVKLKELGVTGLILMPCYEFIETETVDHNKLNYKQSPAEVPPTNYWGFKKGFYFSLKEAYSETNEPEKEFAELVKSLHKNNMELIMMMYFPEEVEKNLINDVLRYYVTVFHVDGFRILGPSLDIDAIVRDPFLKNTKLLLEDDNLNRFYSDKPLKYKNLAHVTPYFNDTARALLKGDEDKIASYSYLFRENNKVYQPLRYISDYYGFTLNDLVSYNVKHNEANGNDNLDGNNYNYSYNWGVEGPTRKTGINRLRLKMIRNALMLFLLPQGTPMLRAGDEWLNSDSGNNNPWNQDNETGWTIYGSGKSSKEIYNFTKALIAFRKRHSVLHADRELRMMDYMSVKIPDISFHSDEAFTMNQQPYSREFGVLLCGDYAKVYGGKKEDSVYIVINMHWEDRNFSIPVNNHDYETGFLYCTDGRGDCSLNEDNLIPYKDNTYNAPGRTVTLFIIKSKKKDRLVDRPI